MVVGGGAAGLTAAIFAAQTWPGLRVVVLDGAPRIGAKILISGGGRCNVTNATVRAQDFNGSQPFIRNVLAAFDQDAAVRWFASLGVPLQREDSDKLFPVSNRARSVVDALLRRCEALEVDIQCGQCVEHLDPADGFLVQATTLAVAAPRVVLATGGRSLPRTGSDGSGWELARRLGHTVTPTLPALVPLCLDEKFFHAGLSGLSHPVELRTCVDGKLADRRCGSLLFTHFGISGPVVLDASRHWLLAGSNGHSVELRCSFVAGEPFEAVERRLLDAVTAQPRRSLLRWAAESMPERLAMALLQAAGIDQSLPLAQLPRAQRRALVHALTDLPLPVVSSRGWDFAEVTAGGIPLREVSFRTMESRRQAGLYLVGEMLDCDGRIGGFNFHWAWATGYLAGRAAASRRGDTRAEQN